jgi:hypothetical protein
LLERVKDEAEARKSIGAVDVGLQRPLDERQRRVEPPAPIIE